MNEDLISRQAVIEELRRYFSEDGFDSDGYWWHSARVMQAIANVPSIEPKTGHWIEDAKTYYGELKKRSLGVDEYTPYFTDDIACSECLAKYSVLDNETQFFKHCPNCGARMEWR